MPKLKGILIDLDGTLANTEDYNLLYAKDKPIETLLEYKLYQFLLPTLKIITWEQFQEIFLRARKEISSELHGTAAAHNRYLYIQRTLELLGINFIPDIIQQSTDYYFEEMLKRTTLYPGVSEALKIFKQHQLKTCIVTDFTADIQIKKMCHLGITKYIDYLVTSEEAGADKPHVEQAVIALKKLHLTQDEVVIIGNNPSTDIELARRIDIASILFDPNEQYKEKKDCATHYVTSFVEIPELLHLEKITYSRKKLLVFDFIGTLTNEKHVVEEVIRPFVHKEVPYVRAEFELLLRGQITEPEFWYRVGIGDITKARKAINAAISIRKSIATMIKNLSETYELVLLTDFPQAWCETVLEDRGIGSYFKKRVYGSDIGTVKPDKALLERVLSLYPTIDPENITVIDNNPAALSSAREWFVKTVLIDNDTEYRSSVVPDAVIPDLIYLPKTLTSALAINR
jgi:putative hydrolase of the HAD superfamily